MGKITPVPIGDFWSEETAKEAAENLYRYLDQEIGAL